jgi:hypothetical protein
LKPRILAYLMLSIHLIEIDTKPFQELKHTSNYDRVVNA